MTDKPVVRDKGTSFLRVFSILEAVVNADAPLSVSDISRTVGLPMATTHRLCKMLLKERLLQHGANAKQLQSGPRLLEFAGQIMAGSPVNLERRALLEALVGEVGETCNIVVPDGMRMTYVERIESHWPLRIQLPVGTQVPMHCTATGKLYLAYLDPPRAGHVLSCLELRPHTKRTIVSMDKLKAELAKIRKQGYATDNEEYIDGLIAVAVPIFDPKGGFYAGLALHAPEARMKLKDAVTKLASLQDTAERISELMRAGPA